MCVATQNAQKPFNMGQGLGALRWRKSTSDDAMLPLSINCWPEAGRSQTNVSVEYSLEREDMTLHNVVITIPLGTSDAPEFVAMCGTHRHNKRDGMLEWVIDVISADNATGQLEFNISQTDEDVFFPLQAGPARRGKSETLRSCRLLVCPD